VHPSTGATAKKPLKDPHSFLGENSALVNLDNLIKPIAPQTQSGLAPAYNPFADNVMPPKTNLFQQQQPAVSSKLIKEYSSPNLTFLFLGAVH